MSQDRITCFEQIRKTDWGSGETHQNRIQATALPQKLQAIPEKSPELLGVILKEGKV